MKRWLRNYWAELLFGFAIGFLPSYAVLILFAYLAMRLTIIYEFLRKQIRVYQLGNEAKIMAIMKKLKVKPEEASKIVDETLKNLSSEERQQLEKDFRDIMTPRA